MLEHGAMSMAIGIYSFSGNRREESSSPSPPSGDAPLESEPGCVLVVDDEPDAVDSIVELLETEGYPALGAHDGREALALLERGLRPGLILLDLKMPVMDGWDFCAALDHEEQFANIPIAIVTASASLHSLPARRNDAGFFLKPINFDRLLRVVRDTCR